MDKVWEVKDPDALMRDMKKKRTRNGPPVHEEKDPAAAYSSSLVAWGLGQLHNDHIIKGTGFLVAMVLTIFGTVLGAIYRNELRQALIDRGVPLANAFLALEAILCALLLFWVYNAADAYHAAARTRRSRFPGVPSRITPLLASLVLPGWGQYLNGQPLKGGLFASLAVIGISSVLITALTFLVWPVLEASDARFLVEEISVLALFALPLLPVLWALGAYDAFAVSNDELLKESLWERLKAAYYRGRTQGLVRGIFPHAKRTGLLILLLAVLVLVVVYAFPAEFYVKALQSLRRSLDERGMTIVPELISRLLERAGAGNPTGTVP